MYVSGVCPVHCGKMAGRMRMPFGMVGRMVPGMRQVVGFGDRSVGRSNFWGKYGVPHCNQWGLFTIVNYHCTAARLLLGEFLELQVHRAASRAGLARRVASKLINVVGRMPQDCGLTCSIILSCSL